MWIEGLILRSIFSLSVRGRDGATAPPAWLVSELLGKTFTCVITFSPRLSNWCTEASQNHFYFYFYFCFLLHFNPLALISVSTIFLLPVCPLQHVVPRTSHDRRHAILHSMCNDKADRLNHDWLTLPACFVAATIGLQPADVSFGAYEHAYKLGWQVSCNCKHENRARHLRIGLFSLRAYFGL
jgi:hypothetical protein